MPQDADHIRQAAQNARFLSTFDLSATHHPDWAVTVAFYTVLHLVEAHFARSNRHCYDHSSRNREVSSQLRAIEVEYMQLYNESRRERYDCSPVTSGDAQRTIRNYYEPVRAHLCNLLGITV